MPFYDRTDMFYVGSQIRVERMKQEMDNYFIYSWRNPGSCSDILISFMT